MVPAHRPLVRASTQWLLPWVARVGVLISLLAAPGCLGVARMAHAAPERSSSERSLGKEWPTPDEVVTVLDDELSLSEDQKARLRPIVAARQEQLKALAADSSPGQLRRARNARSILDESDQAIEALLSEEQKEKYRSMREQMRAQARERMQQRRAGASLTP